MILYKFTGIIKEGEDRKEMRYNTLGNSGIKVSELCFGVLPMGPLQANMLAQEGAKIIRKGLDSGINFLDTAQAYKTYPHIREALVHFPKEVIIASKSHATGYKEMKEAVLEACRELNRSYIDIFHLHAPQEDKDVFQKRAGALSALVDLKKEGIIRAIGISTHAIEVVEKSAEIKEIDVVFPLINRIGLGIIGGKPVEMIQAIKKIFNNGKGVYAMKALAGGYLIKTIEEAITFVRKIKEIQSIAVGMVHSRELEINLKIFENQKINQEEFIKEEFSRKRLIVSRFCEGCGTCVKACPNQALSLRDGKAVVNYNLCLTCGYCVPHCPIFALRIV
jgi:aryl-alcohol dehydrogenase-like predicted oxidoreductase